MSVLAKRLHERRLNIEAEARAVISQAINDKGEKRELTAEEDQKLEALDTEARALVDQIGAILEAEERAKAVEDKLAVYGRTEAAAVDPVDKQMRDFLSGKSGREYVLPGEKRDVTKSTGGTPYGGYTVQTSFYNRLMDHMIEVSGVLSAGATILRTTSGETIQVPKTTSHSTGALVTEGGSISESDPVFGQASLSAYKYGVLVQVSRELIDDTAVDLLGYLAMECGRAVGNAMGTDLVTGDGSSKPAGIVNGSSAGSTGANSVSGAFTAAKLIDLQYSVIAPYRNSPACAWMMRDATVAAVRQLTDSVSGQFLWQPGLLLGAPDVLLGKPVKTDPNVAAVATSAKSVLFGDFSKYFVRLVNGVRFERSDEYAFNTDLVTFRCLVRGDGVLVDQTGAVKHFVGGS